MKRLIPYRRIVVLIFLPALVLMTNAGCDPERGASDQPNIIYVLADDLGYGDLSCYGQKRFQTPHIDRLASEGMRFTRHYSGSTVCAPSRCVLMTGMHTGHSEIRGNRGLETEGQYPLSDSALTVAALLQEQGYKTGAIGKWGLGGPGSTGDPLNQGFDYFFGYNCQREAHFYYPTHLWRNNEKYLIPENENGNKEVYSQDLFIKEALQFIREHKDRPFFLYFPVTIPHAELAIQEQDLEPFKGRYPETPYPGAHYGAQETPFAAFAAMVSRLDKDVGKISALLKELGIDKNTVVIFSSDNGPHTEGGHSPEFFNSNGSLRGVKRDLYEGGIRAPMIARWPGRIEAGTVSNHVSAFWDFLPTALEMAGGELNYPTDGISFLPTLLGETQQEHEYLYWEFHERGGKKALLKGDWKAVQLNIHSDPNGPLELYKLADDPGEDQNLAEMHPDRVTEFRTLMEKARTNSEIFKFTGQTYKGK
ncbi:MAG: arylsulfatase [Bacteroidota bacterium]